MGNAWDDIISPRDRRIYEGAGYGKRGEWGQRPAVIVVDVTYNFVGYEPKPILESIKEFPHSCGEEGWRRIPHIVRLLEGARRNAVPVFFTLDASGGTEVGVGMWSAKISRMLESGGDGFRQGNEIVRELNPQPGDIVLPKRKPSAFFATPLASDLTFLNVDTVILAGCTTSGCIRATAVDGFSYNYRVVVPEECVFDRGELPHKANLFDINAKYGDVVPLAQVLAYLDGLSTDTVR